MRLAFLIFPPKRGTNSRCDLKHKMSPRDTLCFKKNVTVQLSDVYCRRCDGPEGSALLLGRTKFLSPAFTHALIVRQSLSAVFGRRAVTRSTEGHLPSA